MLNNTLLRMREKGETSYGTFSQIKSTIAIENIGCAGFDYVIIDSEHAALGTDFIRNAIVAADSVNLCPLVRVSEISRRAVLHSLDAGAQGLIVPAVEGIQDVEMLVRYAKFAPLGSRGYAPTRDSKWGTDEIAVCGAEAYIEHSNRETLLIPQCETRGCLEHIEEITAMEGVDGIFVGPMDLSIELGCPLQMDSPVLQNAIDRVLAACKKNNKLAMIYAGSAKDAHALAQRGFDSVTVGSDIFVMMAGYRTMARELRGE